MRSIVQFIVLSTTLLTNIYANFHPCTDVECLEHDYQSLYEHYEKRNHTVYANGSLDMLDFFKESQLNRNHKNMISGICEKIIEKSPKYVAEVERNMRCNILTGDFNAAVQGYERHKNKLAEQKIYDDGDLIIKILYARSLWMTGEKKTANDIEIEFISTYLNGNRKLEATKRILYYYVVTNQRFKLSKFLIDRVNAEDYEKGKIWSCKSHFDLFINNILFQERYPSGWSDEIIKKYSELYAENKEFRCKPLPKRFPRPGET
ncbi:hypothetical protein EHQ12_05700 [Leptospira gomenensis]|uniref:Tetratricopeptide repeat protein n=1 Tax=Leptospira gomenensis TaxID=2484974 RepID=A0A5F1YC53_9LEPT|nr:hypothetical protein [Leptospira gomenensis]TGK34812.1 hypothetical protein EHQ17_08370 [Leptospira gomenensis]TGK41869.1 hypothetical protein EHQ12_05700 [Leptospira gomenensis]TGK46037.1 hypothetical protein EHQ07_07375 [Leptospira gomenensis]TGK65143.1 hypothetical protein EHQ13_05980 [Leptospira gomenensis]